MTTSRRRPPFHKSAGGDRKAIRNRESLGFILAESKPETDIGLAELKAKTAGRDADGGIGALSRFCKGRRIT